MSGEISLHIYRRGDRPMIVSIKGRLPHYRRPIQDILALREELIRLFKDRNITIPIKEKIELNIYPPRPVEGSKDRTSSDLINIAMAVCQALDGNTLNQPGVLQDDSLIEAIVIEWDEYFK